MLLLILLDYDGRSQNTTDVATDSIVQPVSQGNPVIGGAAISATLMLLLIMLMRLRFDIGVEDTIHEVVLPLLNRI